MMFGPEAQILDLKCVERFPITGLLSFPREGLLAVGGILRLQSLAYNPIMPVTPQENNGYREFVVEIAKSLGALDLSGQDIVWHYTDGEGFLGILQSSTLYATQVAALNDSKETEYATDLFKKAVREVIQERRDDSDAVAFLNAVLEFVKDEPENPTRGISKFFVTCFSGQADDVNQWGKYAKGAGRYAIGFLPSMLFSPPNSCLYRVIYDRAKQEQATKAIAEATLRFYKEGLNEERLKDPDLWAREFFEAWDEWVYRLAPLAKDYRWQSENEFRIVHELNVSEFPKVRFRQRKTMLSRYVVLEFPHVVKRRASLLPIAKIMIGPGNHPAFTRVSVKLLLEQMGYPDLPVEITNCSLTEP